MTPHPLRRAAAVVAVSVLALGGGAVAAHAAVEEPTPTVSAEPSAPAEPTEPAGPTAPAEPTEPAPSQAPTPSEPAAPTAAPEPPAPSAPAQEPQPEPTSSVVAVPAVTVTQPTCTGLTAVTAGSITVSAGPSADWVVVDDADLDELGEENILLEAQAPGVPGTVEVAPGEYFLFAYPARGEFGDLGEWQQVPGDLMIERSVTITALTGTCPSAAELTDATKGGFTAPATVTAGGTLVLSGLDAGARLRGYLFSTPTDLGVATVAADGTLRLTVPASAAAGVRRVAVYGADGALLGWQSVQVLASGQQLAVTGADPLVGIAAGVVLVVAGGALVLVRRRRAATSA